MNPARSMWMRTLAWVALTTFALTTLVVPVSLRPLGVDLSSGIAYAQMGTKEQLAIIPIARRNGVGSVAPARIEEYLRAMIEAGAVVQLVPQDVVKSARPRFKRSASATMRSNAATKNLAKADEAVITARTMLQDGKNIGTSVKLFTAAIKRYEKFFVELRDFTNYVDANARAAEAYLKLNKKGTAATFLTRALSIQPTLVTNRGDKDMASLLKLVRGRLEKRRKGSIQVECTTPGAEVFVDGVKLGSAPAVAKDLYSGVHFVQVRHEKAEPWGKVFTVRGQLIKVEAKLEMMEDPAQNIHISVPYSKIAPYADEGNFHNRRVRNYSFVFARQIQVRYLLFGVVAPATRGLALHVFLFDAKQKKFAALAPVTFKRNLSNMQMKILEVEGNVRTAIQSFPLDKEVTAQPAVYTRTQASAAAPAIMVTPPSTTTPSTTTPSTTTPSTTTPSTTTPPTTTTEPQSPVVRTTTPPTTTKPVRDPYAHLLKGGDKKTSVVKTWWFWTTLGVLAAGGVTAAVLLNNQQPTASTNFKVDALIQL